MATQKVGTKGRRKATGKAKKKAYSKDIQKDILSADTSIKLPSEILCYVCGRVLWGRAQPLGFGKWRHGDCAPGSPEWRAYFERLPKAQQTEEGRIIYKHHET